MHDAFRPVLGEHALDRLAVGQVRVHVRVRRVRRESCQARLLQAHVVVRVHVVEADHLVAAREQPQRHRRPDEARAAGHQDAHQSRPSTSARGSAYLTSYSTAPGLP
jgi:hypothetical protein